MAKVSKLNQVNVALPAFAMKAAPKVGTHKPVSEKAKQKIREAQLRRHQLDVATSNAASITE
jgi:hypothetical protein